MIQATFRWLSLLKLGVDTVAISLSLVLAYHIRFSSFFHDQLQAHKPFYEHFIGLIFILPLFLFLSFLSGLYRSRSHYFRRELFLRIIRAHVTGTLGVLSLLFVLRTIHYSRWMIVAFALLSPLCTYGGRSFLSLYLKRLRKRGILTIQAALVGSPDEMRFCAEKILAHPQTGYTLVGAFTEEQGAEIPLVYLGGYNDLENVVIERGIEEVLITLPLSEWETIGRLVKECDYIGVKSHIVPGLTPFLSSKPSVDILEGMPLISIHHVPLDDPFNNMIKRFFDILFSISSLVVLSPVLLLVALLIKLTSRGPVIYAQKRVGLNRREFNMYKFRTMTHCPGQQDEQPGWTVKNDPRRTPIGAVLRAGSIDEFPQFFNVLKGDMSVVGPRPERPYFVEEFRKTVPDYMIKHHVRPGITGWAQICGWRGDTDIEERIRHDLFYIENWSISLDLLIILKTPFCGMINPNAY
ncbi:undecaprenyl-phosphate glucose phosphotransferase [Chitinivibrio alkaliphilus]|uniref:Undecaprenyl-phosphate glucose phosphotransferase n=1 Tax=Chitinivibrio alkaliphilus ACht1 TaxID=1313304 RepID=U7D968_9BACT|nr:undecaprenyl-phosphate glucose phosphotransferase [Chitinivibrio alkaliphilus]ERP38934.1 undecaprenyl-phosphate glucose phosphotransferase [Chitinivibrio alkaliphilus ACht1]